MFIMLVKGHGSYVLYNISRKFSLVLGQKHFNKIWSKKYLGQVKYWSNKHGPQKNWSSKFWSRKFDKKNWSEENILEK